MNQLKENNSALPEKDVKEIDIASIFRIILAKWYWIVLVALLLGIAAYLYANFFIAPKYQSFVSMYVVNTNDGLTKSQSVNAGDLQASQHLAQTYAVILKSNTVLDAVVDVINNESNTQKLTRAELNNMISVEAVNETQLLKITVTSTNADYSCLVADAFGKVSPKEIIRITNAGSVELVDHAEVASNPSAPRKSLFAIVGASIGATVSILFFIIRMLTDTTIYLGEDIEKVSSLPVLSLIPDIDPEDGTSRKWKMTEGGVIVNGQINRTEA